MKLVAQRFSQCILHNFCGCVCHVMTLHFYFDLIGFWKWWKYINKTLLVIYILKLGISPFMYWGWKSFFSVQWFYEFLCPQTHASLNFYNPWFVYKVCSNVGFLVIKQRFSMSHIKYRKKICNKITFYQ